MKLEPRIHDSKNGLDYVLTDNYYLPALRLPEDKRPISRWGRLHSEYLKTYRPVLYQTLLLSGKLYTILADLDEQVAERCRLIVQQMAQAEESECHFKYGFSAGLLVQQEAVEQVKTTHYGD